ncbi:MAG: hypothetical protein AB2401_02565 [Bacillus sp. (in: firmicutes)]|jgi:hypothetical protein
MVELSDLINAFFEAFTPVVKALFVPIILWIMIPGLITKILFKRNDAYIIGAFLGLIGMIIIGPFS